MPGSFYLLDTFTGNGLKGNPTPVCILEKSLEVQVMHTLAKEFNAPVTAFVEPKNSSHIFPIKYFTVSGEIPACGHATLGAAFVLFKETSQTQIEFETIEKIRLKSQSRNGLSFVEYPKFNKTDVAVPSETADALGIKTMPASFFCEELQSLFIELSNETEVKEIRPDYRRLTESSDKIKEVVVMSRSESSRYDFVLRSFCPWIGIDEDPVTGSIHSVLGHFWQESLLKSELIAYQASDRGGWIIIRPVSNSVQIGGQCELISERKLDV